MPFLGPRQMLPHQNLFFTQKGTHTSLPPHHQDQPTFQPCAQAQSSGIFSDSFL